MQQYSGSPNYMSYRSNSSHSHHSHASSGGYYPTGAPAGGSNGGHQHRYSQNGYANGHSYSHSHSHSHSHGHTPDPRLVQWFNAVDVDRSGSIDVFELENALVNGDWSKFDIDTVKMLMNIFDVDRSGTINFNEFCGLWKYITEWQEVFRHFDTDRSGSIDSEELTHAMRGFNYRLSPTLMNLLVMKYSVPTMPGVPPAITFDRFVRACVTVKTLTESFGRLDADRDGVIQVNYEEFLKIVLSTP